MTAKSPKSAKPPKLPSLRLHKPSGRGFVELSRGNRLYLGEWGDPETTNKYNVVLGEWLSNGKRLPVSEGAITVLEVVDAYLEHCEVYYRHPQTGKPSSTYTEIKISLDPVLKLYGRTPAVDFGPLALRAVRQGWIDGTENRPGLAITTINSYMGNVRRAFRWAASHQMIPESIHRELSTIDGLRRGRGVGKDPVKRQPVPLADVEATIPHLPRPLQAVVKLLLYTGARPSEVLNLRRSDIDTTGEVWPVIVRFHKGSYLDKPRRLFFGPRAQAAIKPFLLRHDEAFLFDPHEAIAARFERDREADGYKGRRENQPPNPRKTERTLNDHYTYTNLTVAIKRVCADKGITPWTSYQLRHLAATTIEASADLATASAILGHSGLDITQVYVHRDYKTASAWAAVNG